MAIVDFHVAELFVCDSQYADFPVRGKKGAYAPGVYSHVLAAGAVSDIDAELEHGESVVEESFLEFGVCLPVFFLFL